ncbi:hypothetical protein [Nonomuraea sp. NPDC001023]|uniref:hypothetical protein n=1 Tax=unclassified Nonomuraea TaxID=2593643 RepID=UPI00332789D7
MTESAALNLVTSAVVTGSAPSPADQRSQACVSYEDLAEAVVLVSGPSGSGRSTLPACLGGRGRVSRPGASRLGRGLGVAPANRPALLPADRLWAAGVVVRTGPATSGL